MKLSTREKRIAAAALLTVLILFLDQYALAPLLSGLAETRAEKAALAAQLGEAEGLFNRQRIHAKRWRGMVESGVTRSPEEAESAMFHAVREWSHESGLSLSSVKPGKSERVGHMVELTFQVAGAGVMRSVARFLWHIETAAIPVRIEQLQIGSRRDGVDDLSVQLRLSSICAPPASKDTHAKERK